MSQKPSTFITEARERETWLGSAPVEGAGEDERERLLATAALLRGVAQAVDVPEGAEERSRARAVAELQELHLRRLSQETPRAPWYLRLGSFMRFVFTLGRRR